MVIKKKKKRKPNKTV